MMVVGMTRMRMLMLMTMMKTTLVVRTMMIVELARRRAARGVLVSADALHEG